MRSTDHTAPFDHEVETASDMTQEFWGSSGNWESSETRRQRWSDRADDTGSLRAIRDGVAAFRPRRVELRDPTGQVRRTRAHGESLPPETVRSDPRATATIGELAAGRYDEVIDDGFDPAERSGPEHDLALLPVEAATARFGVGGLDPLLVRLGVMILIGVLLVPLALALRPSSGDPDTVRIDAPTEATPAPAGATPALAPARTPLGDAAEESSPPATVAASDVASAPAAPAPPSEDVAAVAEPAVDTSDTGVESAASDGSVGDVSETEDVLVPDAATVAASAERIVPNCPQTYDAAPGDSWYGIARAAGVSPTDLMAENRATVDTVILTGSEICLPSGATMPTISPDPAPVDTAAPTTAAPTTAPPAPAASAEQVKALIRQTWPADQHETALRIAQRESKFNPRADNNWCCYGVFQIYYEVHKGWLDDFGVARASDLFDAEKNIAAAYHLYERAGGWGPWGG